MDSITFKNNGKKCLYCHKLLSLGRWKYCSNVCSAKRRYIKNKLEVLQKSKEWKKKNKDKNKIIKREYYRRHPEQQFAQKLARKQEQKLKKSNCEMCGSKEMLEMHHPDYTQPLKVVTLCKKCHNTLQNVNKGRF